MTGRSWTLVVDCCGRPVLSNARMHYQQRATAVRAWREAGCVLARQARIPRLSSVKVTCWGRYPDRRTPDVDAVAPTLKAVLDGIVDARVIPDDKPPYVTEVRYLAPRVVKGCRPALVVLIEEVAA